MFQRQSVVPEFDLLTILRNDWPYSSLWIAYYLTSRVILFCEKSKNGKITMQELYSLG
jgi:hypothetical protein